MSMSLGKIATCTVLALFGSTSQAHPKTYGATPNEIAMMPKACQVKLSPALSGNIALQTYWSDRIGHDCWIHMHHYCHGLKSVIRSKLTFDNTDKRFYLEQAIGEFDYVLQHCPANSPMIPETKLQKQQVDFLLKLIPR